MAIYDNNGTASTEIGKLYDNNGSANTQIDKVYDNNGTASSLVYEAIPYLYNKGDRCTALTGGWTGSARHSVGSWSESNGVMSINCYGITMMWLHTVNMIDLTNYSKLCINVLTSTTGAHQFMGVESSSNYDWPNNWPDKYVNTSAGLITLDISGLSGKYYVTVKCCCDSHITFDQVYLVE